MTTGGGGGGAATGSGAGAASPGLPMSLRRLTSTTTLLVRPWLKVCLTSPAWTEVFSPSGFLPKVGLVSVSLMTAFVPFKNLMCRRREGAMQAPSASVCFRSLLPVP